MTRLLFLTGLALLSFNAHAQIPKPVAKWNFNGNTNDKTGNGWHATNYGCTATTGKGGFPNTAYRFNGSGNYMMVPHQSGMNMKTWTLMALIKPSGFYAGNCQGNMIMERGLFFSGNSHCLFYGDNFYDNSCTAHTPGQEVFAASAASGTPHPLDWKSGIFIDTTQWYCVAATYGNDTMKLYVNGVLAHSGYWQDTYNSGITDSLRIGCGTLVATYPNWFNGIMDHISIYNSVLSGLQIDTVCANANIDTTTLSVNDDMLAIEKALISPNPAGDRVTISLPGYGGTATEVCITNTIGQVVLKMIPQIATIHLDISSLPKGVYIIRAYADDRIYYEKLVKQ